MIELSMNGLFAGFKPGAGETLVVLFSHRDTQPGRFSQFKALGEQTTFPVLFLNCPHGTWYTEGIPPFGADPVSTAAALRQHIASLGFERFMCMGFSMGGYGSLLYGALMDADVIASFSPEAVLNFFDNRSREQREGKTSPHDSLLHLLDRRTKPTHVFIGTDDMCDVLQGSLIAYRTAATVHSLPGVTHGTLAALRDMGLLTPLLAELMQTASATTLASVAGPLPPEVCTDYQPPAPLGEAAVVAAYEMIHAATGLPAQAFYIGRRYLAREDYAAATTWFERAAAAAPSNEEYAGYLRRTRRRNLRLQKAGQGQA